MGQETCICLHCGRIYILALPDGAEVNDQSCPVCKNKNLIKHDGGGDFFSSLFSGGG